MHLRHDPEAPAAKPIAFEQFLAVDIRVGRIVAAEPFPVARKPAYKLTIDFGPAIGAKRSSAQITENYTPEVLAGRLVAAVVNFPPRQIGKLARSEHSVGEHERRGAHQRRDDPELAAQQREAAANTLHVFDLRMS